MWVYYSTLFDLLLRIAKLEFQSYWERNEQTAILQTEPKTLLCRECFLGNSINSPGQWLLYSGFFITRSRHQPFTPSTDLFNLCHYSSFRVFSNRFLFWCQCSVLKVESFFKQLGACPLLAPHALALAGTSFPCSSPQSFFEQHSSSDHTSL